MTSQSDARRSRGEGRSDPESALTCGRSGVDRGAEGQRCRGPEERAARVDAVQDGRRLRRIHDRAERSGCRGSRAGRVRPVPAEGPPRHGRADRRHEGRERRRPGKSGLWAESTRETRKLCLRSSPRSRMRTKTFANRPCSRSHRFAMSARCPASSVPSTIPKPNVRQQAAFALSQLRDPSAVPGLIAALKDNDADVRQQAAFALSQIGDESAIDALTAAIKDPVADVRQQAIFALTQIADGNGGGRHARQPVAVPAPAQPAQPPQPAPPPAKPR